MENQSNCLIVNIIFRFLKYDEEDRNMYLQQGDPVCITFGDSIIDTIKVTLQQPPMKYHEETVLNMRGKDFIRDC